MRRSAQTNADRLLISAASAIRKAGSRTSMTGDSELARHSFVAYLFPKFNRKIPIRG